MLRLQTISTNYKGYDAEALVTLGINVVFGLTSNEYYPVPAQQLAEVKKALAELSNASHAMKTGLKAATQQRDYARKQVETQLKELSAYAVGATPDRPDLWAAANFPLTKAETSPRQPSQPVTGLLLADGTSVRTLQARVDAQRGMYGYQWRIFPKDTTPEQLASGFCYRFCTTRRPKVLLENLESGVTYGVESAAWNETGPLQWSLPVFRIVQ